MVGAGWLSPACIYSAAHPMDWEYPLNHLCPSRIHFQGCNLAYSIFPELVLVLVLLAAHNTLIILPGSCCNDDDDEGSREL